MSTEVIDKYLQSMHCTMWGRAFDVSSPDSRAQAVEWLNSVIGEVCLIVEDGGYDELEELREEIDRLAGRVDEQHKVLRRVKALADGKPRQMSFLDAVGRLGHIRQALSEVV